MKIILFLLCCITHAAFAQQDAWVYFADKENVEASLQNPLTILTQQAVDRKNLHNISIDVRDVPVSAFYIATLKATETIAVLAKSKWMNAVHVRGTLKDIEALFSFEFVRKIDFADRTLTDLARPNPQHNKSSVVTTTNDFVYGNAKNQTDMIQVDALHNADYRGDGIKIAVFDSGFPNVNTLTAYKRLRDANKFMGGYDFVDRTSAIFAYKGSSHGTRVLSTMAGFIEDKFVGTAPDASYYLFRTEDATSENPVEESYWVEAAERADSLGVHIITSSLGYNTFDNANYNYTPEEMNGSTTFISKGANIAAEKGILVVNSAGNSGNTTWRIVTAPADAPGVFTIGAVDSNGDYAFFSSRGSTFQPTQKPDVVAQGLGSFVIDETGAIVSNNGTSFSAPIIAGAIASLWQAMPTATAAQIKTFIRSSASQYESPDDLLGYGIPNFNAALSLTLSTKVADANSIKVYPNPVSDQLYLRFPSHTKDGKLQIYNVFGQLVREQVLTKALLNIHVSELASGLYILKIKSDNTTHSHKFIKQ